MRHLDDRECSKARGDGSVHGSVRPRKPRSRSSASLAVMTYQPKPHSSRLEETYIHIDIIGSDPIIYLIVGLGSCCYPLLGPLDSSPLGRPAAAMVTERFKDDHVYVHIRQSRSKHESIVSDSVNDARVRDRWLGRSFISITIHIYLSKHKEWWSNARKNVWAVTETHATLRSTTPVL